MSVLCFLLFALDKRLAVKRRRRIRESTLIGCMWLFGAAGGLFSMCLFRHKTSRAYFWLNGVFALLLQLFAAWLFAAQSFR